KKPPFDSYPSGTHLAQVAPLYGGAGKFSPKLAVRSHAWGCSFLLVMQSKREPLRQHPAQGLSATAVQKVENSSPCVRGLLPPREPGVWQMALTRSKPRSLVGDAPTGWGRGGEGTTSCKKPGSV